ncbi:alpha-(1,3)-fucosyltransferase 10-like [Homarus americanus]|uniref:alpha-(1,3)-fucosyltransferase 10-like n=1 Tax=Homarus americanus TaxID=6706 RepID=UPI001C440B58|nr:alpha-(1,3)-fucosyltransferase 10-like [Homarus americanus]
MKLIRHILLVYFIVIDTSKVINCNGSEGNDGSSLQRGHAAPTGRQSSPGQNIILWWTPFTGISGQSRNCDLGSCYFTEDRSYIHNKKTKAVLFYGSDFNIEDLPLPRRSRQWWALLHEESPKNQPLFDHQPVLELFNLTSTFRRESNFPLTLQHLESIQSLTTTKEFIPTNQKTQLMATDNLAPIVYVQSNCDTPSERDNYVEELSKYIKIDSYGACLHNKDLPSHLIDPAENFDHWEFRSLMARYKFTLSIENAACEDYITEKLWRPITLGSVPIYWGSPTIQDWLPNPSSIIPISDFQSPRELATYITTLLDDDKQYESYLTHKLHQIITNNYLLEAMNQRKWGINNDFERGNFIEHYECYVCDQILTKHGKLREKGHLGVFMASLGHYGCPEPSNTLTGTPNPKSFWVQQWHKGRIEAMVLNRLISTSGTLSVSQFYQEVIEELQNDGFFVRYPPEHEEL